LSEAALLAGKPVHRFRHCDPAALAARLRDVLRAGQRPLVMTDGVFPVTGKLAPLRRYVEVLQDFDSAVLQVDDAHAFGVLGDQGRGSLEHLGLWERGVNQLPNAGRPSLVVGGTLSKAMGGFGGVICGTRDLIQKARAASHYYDGASAPPAPIAAATAKAIEVQQRDPNLRRRLQQNIQRARRALGKLGLEFADSPAANIGVRLGDAANMERVHERLKQAGILVPYVRAYSGTGADGLLRIAVCALHTDAMIDRLVGELRSHL
jgi:7-keto-8-aminopelargonate synthetase-like enzyme